MRETKEERIDQEKWLQNTDVIPIDGPVPEEFVFDSDISIHASIPNSLRETIDDAEKEDRTHPTAATHHNHNCVVAVENNKHIDAVQSGPSPTSSISDYESTTTTITTSINVNYSSEIVVKQQQQPKTPFLTNGPAMVAAEASSSMKPAASASAAGVVVANRESRKDPTSDLSSAEDEKEEIRDVAASCQKKVLAARKSRSMSPLRSPSREPSKSRLGSDSSSKGSSNARKDKFREEKRSRDPICGGSRRKDSEHETDTDTVTVTDTDTDTDTQLEASIRLPLMVPSKKRHSTEAFPTHPENSPKRRHLSDSSASSSNGSSLEPSISPHGGKTRPLKPSSSSSTRSTTNSYRSPSPEFPSQKRRYSVTVRPLPTSAEEAKKLIDQEKLDRMLEKKKKDGPMDARLVKPNHRPPLPPPPLVQPRSVQLNATRKAVTNKVPGMLPKVPKKIPSPLRDSGKGSRPPPPPLSIQKQARPPSPPKDSTMGSRPPPLSIHKQASQYTASVPPTPVAAVVKPPPVSKVSLTPIQVEPLLDQQEPVDMELEECDSILAVPHNPKQTTTQSTSASAFTSTFRPIEQSSLNPVSPSTMLRPQAVHLPSLDAPTSPTMTTRPSWSAPGCSGHTVPELPAHLMRNLAFSPVNVPPVSPPAKIPMPPTQSPLPLSPSRLAFHNPSFPPPPLLSPPQQQQAIPSIQLGRSYPIPPSASAGRRQVDSALPLSPASPPPFGTNTSGYSSRNFSASVPTHPFTPPMQTNQVPFGSNSLATSPNLISLTLPLSMTVDRRGHAGESTLIPGPYGRPVPEIDGRLPIDGRDDHLGCPFPNSYTPLLPIASTSGTTNRSPITSSVQSNARVIEIVKQGMQRGCVVLGAVSPRSDGSGSTNSNSRPAQPGYNIGKLHHRVFGRLLDKMVLPTMNDAQRGLFTWKADDVQLPMFPQSTEDYMDTMLSFTHKKIMQELQPKLASFSLRELDDPSQQGEILVKDDDKRMGLALEEKSKFIKVKVRSFSPHFRNFSYFDLVVVKIPAQPSIQCGLGSSEPSYIFASVCSAADKVEVPRYTGRKDLTDAYEIILLIDDSNKALFVAARKIFIVAISNLQYYHGQMKGLFNLDHHPLAPALTTLEEVWMSDPDYRTIDQMSDKHNALQPLMGGLNSEQKDAFFTAAHAVLHDPRPRVSVIRGAPGTGKMRVTVSILKALTMCSASTRILLVVPSEADVKNTVERICSAWRRQYSEDAPKGLLYILQNGGPPNDTPMVPPRSLSSKIKAISDPGRDRIMTLIGQQKDQLRSAKDETAKKRHQKQLDNLQDELAKPGRTKRSLQSCYDDILKDLNILVTSPRSIYDKANELNLFYDRNLATFDCVIFYHAGRLCELDGLLALTRGPIRKAVFVGDHMEIPTDVTSEHAVAELPSGPLGSSFLTRVQRAYNLTTNMCSLERQYVLPRDILAYPNMQFYEDLLKPDRNADDAVRSSPFFQYRFVALPEDWINPNTPEAFVPDRDDDFRRIADLMAEIVKSDNTKTPTKKRYAILVRIEEDCRRFREVRRLQTLQKDGKNVDVDISTVVGFRGRTRPIVLFYAGCDGLTAESELETRRICMALMSATESLFVAGHPTSLKRNRAWADLIKNANERKDVRVALYENKKASDFVREKLLRDEPGRGFQRRY
ncbi:hypothetical protein BV898_07889 [Hypsibius exemplaris]|uniref:DNA2/NAM7 helicase helicase domain-containing protein n=1 Tax=Hypsibius exemplaris TaxID=2072580 RepID=A0A1W0WRX2_HYPEX|nr:hypothetical protein BV898_07889 [Hypsibius exemplaris]